VALVQAFEDLNPAAIGGWVRGLSESEALVALEDLFDWEGAWARNAQKEPEGNWRVWLINAGRGFGKTRSGAEWVRKLIETGRSRRMALVGRTTADVRDVMIEGESGLLAVSTPTFYPQWLPSKRKLVWPRTPPKGISRISVGPTPAEAHTYTADEPDLLRGPQHDAAWCDELAAWRFKDAWDNLMLGLRIGEDPRCCVTTTPKPILLLRRIMERPGTVVTGGSTYENIANLAPAFIEEIIDEYEGTAKGEQELYAKLLTEAEGALWKREWIEENRVSEHPDLDLLVVAIDPAMTSHEESSETGIIGAGRAWIDGLDHYYILGDASGRHSPDAWATCAIDLLEQYEGDEIVGEVNNGGDLVEYTLRTVDPEAPYHDVRASRGKQIRAAPIASLYEQGRVHHVGVFSELEDQLCNWEPRPGSTSPDRLDADVWAISRMRPKKRRVLKNLDLSDGLDRVSPWTQGG